MGKRVRDLARVETTLPDSGDFAMIGDKDIGDNDFKITILNYMSALEDGMKALPRTLTNKSIDSDNNTITHIVNADIKDTALIAFSKLAALTQSRALVSGAGVGGPVEVSDVTAAELAFLDGVTSALQTQLDAKAATVHTHASPLRVVGGTGSFLETYAVSATGTSVNGNPTFDIAVNVPNGSAVIGCALRVDVALSHAASGAYTGGASQTIGNIAAAQNSKIETMYDPNTNVLVSVSAVNVRITADSAANFSNSTGEVMAIIYYKTINPIDNVGA